MIHCLCGKLQMLPIVLIFLRRFFSDISKILRDAIDSEGLWRLLRCLSIKVFSRFLENCDTEDVQVQRGRYPLWQIGRVSRFISKASLSNGKLFQEISSRPTARWCATTGFDISEMAPFCYPRSSLSKISTTRRGVPSGIFSCGLRRCWGNQH